MTPQRGRGGRGGWQHSEVPPADDAAAWFAGRLPDDWFTGPAEVSVDRDEILVVGTLPPVEVEGDAAAIGAAESGRIDRFRADTREERMAIARHAQHRYGRTVSWGAVCGGTRGVFTTQSVPVMTRLRQADRQVLDTLVDAGVARSRSEALAWSVRLVGEHAEAWLGELKEAMTEVDRLRSAGPDLT
ncbi:MAG: hypothetical protein H0V67_04380 [Geodermatophilaceae bacterium]|nr:hypothetical protein [Geodermatophilaceae bacterium]